jgi:hypothetical protein
MHSNTDTSFTTANITVSNVIWGVWNEAYQQSLTMQWRINNSSPPEPEIHILNPAGIEAERLREQERRQREIERTKHRLLIKTRADRLLRQHLTPEQIASLEQYGHFVVVSESGKH